MKASKRVARSKTRHGPANAVRARSEWDALSVLLDEVLLELRRAGLADPIDGLEQVAQLIYLKCLDEREPVKGSVIFPGMAERFRWSRFCTLPGPELKRFLRDHVLSYMSSLVREAPAVSDYYRDATLKIEDTGALLNIIHLLDEIDFQQLKPDEMGRILEYLLESTKPSGEFRTPHHIRALMVTLVEPSKGETIYDPACGTGGYLTDAVVYLLAKYSSAPREMPIYGEGYPVSQGGPLLQMWREEGGESSLVRTDVGNWIHGHDISRRMVRIARINLELQGIGVTNVRRASSLSMFGGLTTEEMSRRFNVILCAPPFGDAPSRDSLRPDLPVPSTRMELLFLEVAMQNLASTGRCAIIVPDSLLSGEGSTFVKVRRRLLSMYEVLAVVSLPPSVFRSGVKTSIIVFRRPESIPHFTGTDRVWFYEIQHDGYGPDRTPLPEKNDIPDLLVCWERFKQSSYSMPPGPRSGDVVDAEETARCWWATRQVIEDNQFEMSVGRYKPRSVVKPSILATEIQFAALETACKDLSFGMEALFENMRRATLLGGWVEGGRHAKLGELVDVITGKTPTTTVPSYWNGEIPWVSPKDMKRYVLEDSQDHVNQSAVDELQLKVIEPPAVLIVVRSMILSHRVPIAVSTVPVVINQDLRALKPRLDRGVDAWYLFAYLNSVQDWLLAHTLGTGHGSRSLSQRFFLGLDVPIPTAEVREQTRRVMKTYVKLAETAGQMSGLVKDIFPSLLSGIFGSKPGRPDGYDRSRDD